MDDWSSAKLCDVADLILGMILFFSPWLFGLAAGAQWQTASITGIIIAVLSIAALAAFAVWEEWLSTWSPGLWLMVAPWLPGFQNSDAMTIDLVIGTIVTLLAAFEFWLGSPTQRGRGSRRATEFRGKIGAGAAMKKGDVPVPLCDREAGGAGAGQCPVRRPSCRRGRGA